MEVKLRGLDRYEVEAIQYDGTNSDEICQFILEREPYTQIEGAFLNKGTDKKMMAVIVIPSGENILARKGMARSCRGSLRKPEFLLRDDR